MWLQYILLLFVATQVHTIHLHLNMDDFEVRLLESCKHGRIRHSKVPQVIYFFRHFWSSQLRMASLGYRGCSAQYSTTAVRNIIPGVSHSSGSGSQYMPDSGNSVRFNLHKLEKKNVFSSVICNNTYTHTPVLNILPTLIPPKVTFCLFLYFKTMCLLTQVTTPPGSHHGRHELRRNLWRYWLWGLWNISHAVLSTEEEWLCHDQKSPLQDSWHEYL